jgi:hypothetical protein
MDFVGKLLFEVDASFALDEHFYTLDQLFSKSEVVLNARVVRGA